MKNSTIKPFIVQIDLTPFQNLSLSLKKTAESLQKINEAGGLTKYIEKLRIENEKEERDRRWRDDPLRIKAHCIDPAVESFRMNAINVLEWILKRLKENQ